MTRSKLYRRTLFLSAILITIVGSLIFAVHTYRHQNQLFLLSNVISSIRQSNNELELFSELLRLSNKNKKRDQQRWSQSLENLNVLFETLWDKTERSHFRFTSQETLEECKKVWREVYPQLKSCEIHFDYLEILPEEEALDSYIFKNYQTLEREKLYRLAQLNYELKSFSVFAHGFFTIYFDSIAFEIEEKINQRRTTLLIEIIIFIPLFILVFLTIMNQFSHYDREKRLIMGKIGEMRRMEEIGRSTGQISHDLKNLLGAITAYVDLIAIDTDCSEKQNDYLQNINATCERAIELARTITQVSRTDSESFTDVELFQLLTGVRKILPVMIPKKIQLSVEMPDRNCIVHGSEMQLYQVLMNLVINASHAISGKGEIAISSAIENNEIHLTISDTGSGIREEDMRNIFKSGFTTKSTTGGSGFGLSIVKNIIENHNGRITVTSKVNSGTTFHIYLPKSGC